MNPFRSRKKSVTEANNQRPIIDDSAPPVPSTRGRTFRRKKTQPQPKPVIDLATVLPSSDDFRTSLILPNLSARFSMLREQDDPTTKVGKASDDSVLFPKRASRLNLFGHEAADLTDIAEVSSLSGSIRPPFAADRSHSFASDDAGYHTDDKSSILTRPKPGHGNKLFGGRQKVYKIPTGAVSAVEIDTSEASPYRRQKGLGKAVYDDDMHLSAFQSLRLKEKENHQGRSSNDTGRSTEDYSSPSQSMYDGKRETSSSTTSATFDGQPSTAATSVTSQNASPLFPPSSVGASSISSKGSPVAPTGFEKQQKGKRLYGQGLDQHIHEQQSSALHRLNSIQRTYGLGGANGGLAASRSATNLHDRFQKSGNPMGVSNSPQTGSPSAASTGLGGFDFGPATSQAPANQRSRSNSRDQPTSRPISPAVHPDAALVAALEPNDLGKATASGAFNKPKAPYSEQQYAQRQMQLQEGRETPPLRSFSRNGFYGSESFGRLRNDSVASQRSAQSGRSLPYATAENSRSASSASGSIEISLGRDPTGPPSTFLAGLSESENEADEPSGPNGSAPLTGPSNRYEHDDQHPAFQRALDMVEEDEPAAEPTENMAGLLNVSDTHPAFRDGRNDSVTVPEAVSGAGLSDLVRGHLRTQSDQSSVYSDPGDLSTAPTSAESPFMDTSADPYNYRTLTGAYNAVREQLDQGAPTQTSPMALRAKQMLEQAKSMRNDTAALEKEYNVPPPTWPEQARGHHREASTETQKEREEFASELADRRRQVRDNLKSIVQEESRAPSPTNARIPDTSPAKSNGFRDAGSSTTSKAMKILGVGSYSPSTSKANGFDNTPPNQTSRRPSNDPARGPWAHGSRDPQGKVGPGGAGPSFRDRSIGAERRERFFARGGAAASRSAPHLPSAAGLPPDFSRPKMGPTGQPQQMSYHPAGRARKYSPPRPAITPDRPLDAAPRLAMPPAVGAPAFAAHQTPPLDPPGSFISTPSSAISNSPFLPPLSSSSGSSTASTTTPGASTSIRSNAPRKRSISKHEISEPLFLSGTSSVLTVDLPHGASLAHGAEPGRDAMVPPVPPINPLRNRLPRLASPGGYDATRSRSGSGASTPLTAQSERAPAGAPFAFGEADARPYTVAAGAETVTNDAVRAQAGSQKSWNRLRKTSSEGGSLAAKARQQARVQAAEGAPASPAL